MMLAVTRAILARLRAPADFLRSFRAHSGDYVSERIAKKMPPGAAAVGAALLRQAPGELDSLNDRRGSFRWNEPTQVGRHMWHGSH